jgi:hypothetical protein
MWPVPSEVVRFLVTTYAAAMATHSVTNSTQQASVTSPIVPMDS